MCFKRNNADKVKLAKILKGKMQINELDLNYKENEDIAIAALNQQPALARKLKLSVATERSVLIKWLTKDVNRIVHLDPATYISEQRHDNEVLFLYLNAELSAPSDKSDYSFVYSIDNYPVLQFEYVTSKGEEIRYYDDLLDLPASLLARLNIAIKITDAYKFLKYLDIHLQQVTMDKIYKKLVALISTTLNKAIQDTIAENDLCYYRINSYYNVIVDKMTAAINEEFRLAGSNIADIRLYRIRLLENYGDIYEHQRAIFMQKEKEIELRHKEEMLSLEVYEKKADVHKRYPGYEVGLTEKEKDNAIARYINKCDGYIPQEYIDPSKATGALTERNSTLSASRKVTAFRPEKEEKKKKKLDKYHLLMFIGLLFLIVGGATVGFMVLTGCIFMAAAVACCGVWLALFVNKKKQAKMANMLINTNASSIPEDNE